MKKIILFLILMLFAACSSPKDPLPNSAHPQTWLNVNESEFHGTKVVESGLFTCATCHGVNFDGGKSETSCYTCHDNYPHNQQWTDIGDTTDSHKAYINQKALDIRFNSCKNCHGDNFDGGRLGTEHACSQCHDQATVNSW